MSVLAKSYHGILGGTVQYRDVYAIVKVSPQMYITGVGP